MASLSPTGAEWPSEVKKDGSAWVIPSQYIYPADGGTRVGATSGGVLNVRPGAKITDDTKKHAELGVVIGSRNPDKEGRGKRVTLKDAGGAVLVDLIIGKKAELADVYYVRDARQNDVYTAKVDPDIRTSFKDWVETDLLKINGADIRTVAIKDYTVDAGKGQVNMRELRRSSTSQRTRPGGSADKTPEGKDCQSGSSGKDRFRNDQPAAGGIRPFSVAPLQARGFYVANGNPPTVYGKEGVVEVTTKDGVRYKLYFGSGALGDDFIASAESKTDAAANACETSCHTAVLTEYDAALDEDKPAIAGG